MAKKKKSAKKSAKKSTGNGRSGDPNTEPCPACGETRELYWHGRRVLCESCVDNNTHEAERGEITIREVVSGALALFREVGSRVIAVTLAFSIPLALVHVVFDLSDDAAMIFAFGSPFVFYLVYGLTFDLGLTVLDGETPKLGSSLGVAVRKFLPLALANQLQILIVAIHTVLLIVPGIIKAASYALVMPLVISGEAGAISCLHESGRRMHGYRAKMLPLLAVLWLPFLAIQVYGLATLANLDAGIADAPTNPFVDILFPLTEIPWIFVTLSLHAKLRARFRIRA
ncbi:MAG: hypothetical protein DRJ42_23985 [Deltaproteobacteria bacterium]|nr:MAG: hypothetical protein DRJ42_23985 [Deltaproteobacteria bacterium]